MRPARRRGAGRWGAAARGLRFLAVAAGLAVGLVGLVQGFGWYATYQAESFGDRRLAAPSPGECAAARAVVDDFARRRRAALLAEAGAVDQKMRLRAFAWASKGPRAGRGADWRKCPGLGRQVRGLGFERMGFGEQQGPALYISRERIAAPGEGMSLWVTFFPPPPPSRKSGPTGALPGPRTWLVGLRAGRAGTTRIATNWIPADAAGALP